MANQELVANIKQTLQQALPLTQFTKPFDGISSVTDFLDEFSFQCQLKAITKDAELLRHLALHLVGAPLQLFKSRVNLDNLDVTFVQFAEILKVTFSPRHIISDIEIYERLLQDNSELDVDFAFRAYQLYKRAYPNQLVEQDLVISLRRKFRTSLRDYLYKYNIPSFAELISYLKKFHEKSRNIGDVEVQANLQGQIDVLTRQLSALKVSQNSSPVPNISYRDFPKPSVQLPGEKAGSSKVNSKLICRYCKKPGHLLDSCFKLLNKKKQESMISKSGKVNVNNANFFYFRKNSGNSPSPKKSTPFRNTTVPLHEFSPKQVRSDFLSKSSVSVEAPLQKSKSKRKRRSRKKPVATPNGLFSEADFDSSGTSLDKILYFRCTSSGGKHLKLVLDSGASENMVDSRLAEQLNCKVQTASQPVNLISASGNVLRVANFIDLVVHMPSGINISCNRFFIVKNLPTGIIAGNPFLLEKRSLINYDTGYLTIRNSIGSTKIMLCGSTQA